MNSHPFDELVRSMFPPGDPEPTKDFVFHLIALRLFAEPRTVCVWEAPKGALGLVQTITSHYSFRFRKTPSTRRVFFICPERYRTLLLPDLYTDMSIPEATPVVTDAMVGGLRASYNLNPDTDDFAGRDRDSSTVTEAIEMWSETLADEDGDDHVSASVGRGAKRLAGAPRHRLSEAALRYLWTAPDVVLRACLLGEGRSGALEAYEVRELRAMCRVPVTFRQRGEVYEGY